MAYIPFAYNEAPFLAELPHRKGGFVECDVSKYVPDSAKEILVYTYITVKTADRRKKRAVYQIYTQDTQGRQYSQLMNTAFPEDDFVLNSANLWLPIVGERKFFVKIPDSWTTDDGTSEPPKRHSYKTLNDAMIDFVSGKDSIYSGIFLMGYR